MFESEAKRPAWLGVSKAVNIFQGVLGKLPIQKIDVSDGDFKHFLIFYSDLFGEIIQSDYISNSFQMGWFNHLF